MHIIVGLGNPGTHYEHTRHNVGFMVIDELAKKWGMTFKKKPALRAEIAEGFVGEDKIILVKPQTFMNDSGLAVQATRAMFGVEVAKVIIISDDVDLPFPTMRIRTTGGSGGHNGLKSLITHLNSPDFVRVRVGVNAAPENFPLEDWVLGNLTSEERSVLLALAEMIREKIVTGMAIGFREETI